MVYVEVIVLGNVALFFSLLIGQVVYRAKLHGSAYAMGSLDGELQAACESRIIRVKRNQQETLFLVFAIALMGSIIQIPETNWILILSVSHVVSRAVYVSVALRGIPVVRSLVWMFGVVCLLTLALTMSF